MPQHVLLNQRIELEGVRVHNLKNLSLTLPLGKWITCCGVSGSGKSSLAFDTVHAESQRRYLETFSPYSRQFIKRLETPQADRIGHLPPTIAVQQYEGQQHPRSTVGTATSCHEYLALLFARLGVIICSGCGQEIHRETPADVLRVIETFPAGTRYQIAFPVLLADSEEEGLLQFEGFDRVAMNGRTLRLRDEGLPADSVGQEAWVIVDRLAAGKTAEERVLDSLELAFRSGEDRCLLLSEEEENGAGKAAVLDGKPWTLQRFSSRLICEECGIEFLEPEPRLFRYQSPLGACPACAGTGLDAEGNLCEICHGARLQPLALAVRVGGLNIAELSALTIAEVRERVDGLLTAHPEPHAQTVLRKLADELDSLIGVGLEYLSLDRRMTTLSTGEAQRVALSAVLGTRLVNTLYVLDEPSVGLHMRDTEKLITVLRELQASENTLLVVEHEAAFLRAAEEIIEIGPGAGAEGGQLVFQGTSEEFFQAENSLTSDFATGRKTLPVPESPRQPLGWLKLTGCQENNLKNIAVEFPLGVFCVVSGVSGSGKSSLVESTLYPALANALEQPGAPVAGPYESLTGADQIQQVVMVDRQPVGNSPRSVPATYLKAFDEIRKVFAKSRDAKRLNLTARDFSFNTASGKRCPKCQGQGTITVDLQFLADLSITCPDCQGTRYLPEILEVKHRNRSIADVLAMTAQEAFIFFRGQPKLQKQIQCLKDVGLGYIPLGQPATTLSGGESQRLKIASYLATASARRVLFLMEEPSMGLHPADLVQLLHCFSTLLNEGHSLIVIEHNLDLIRSADWVIDLGPKAGDQGGHVVSTGTPAAIANTPESITGQYLREMFPL